MNKKTIFILLALVGLIAMSMTLPAKAATGTITGRVVDQDHNPVQGVAVLVWESNWDAGAYINSTTTNSSGVFSVNLAEGNYTLRFVASPVKVGDKFYVPPRQQRYIPVTDGETTDYTPAGTENEFALAWVEANVRGILKDPDGFPAAGSEVYIHTSSWDVIEYSTTTSNGEFAFSVPINDYIIEAKISGSGYIDANSLDIPLSDDNPISSGNVIQFTKPNFQGKVVTPESVDVPSAGVTLHNSDWSVNKWTQTGGDGMFYFGGIIADTYELIIDPPTWTAGFEDYSQTIESDIVVNAEDIAGDNVKDIGSITLEVPNVMGVVYGPVGTAHATSTLENIPVEVYTIPNDWYVTGESTDSNGQFKISVPDEGTYRLKITSGDYGGVYSKSEYTLHINADGSALIEKDTEELTKDEDNFYILRLSNPLATGLKITIQGAAGPSEPIQGAWVGLGIQEGMQGGDWSGTNASGAVVFGDIDIDTIYRLEVNPPWDSSYTRLETTVEITSDNNSDADHKVDPSGRALTIQLKAPNICGYLYNPETLPVGYTTSTYPNIDEAANGAWVNLHTPFTGGPGGGNQEWYNAAADNNGKFCFGNITISGDSKDYVLEIEAPYGSPYSAPSSIDVTITKAQAEGDTTYYITTDGDLTSGSTESNPIRLKLPDIIGTIVDDKEDGVSNCWIMAHDQYWTFSQGSNTDESGKFTLGGLDEAKTYLLEINTPWGWDKNLVVPSSNIKIEYKSNKWVVTQDEETLTDNIIQLELPGNEIKGNVYIDKNNNGKYDPGTDEDIRSARINANGQGMNCGHFETSTAADGSYSLGLADGSFWLEVMRDWNMKNDWLYDGTMKQVTFGAGNATTTTINFEVKVCDATIKTTVQKPDGTVMQNVWVEAHRQGPGNGASTNSDGQAFISVPAGTYMVEVFAGGEDYGSPDPVTVTVKSGETVEAGVNGIIELKAKDAKIKGKVTDSDNNSQKNVMVNAWQMDGMGWANSMTDSNGNYTLKVFKGTWMVMVMPMSQDYIYREQPKEIEVDQGETSDNNDFELARNDATISGNIYEDKEGGTPGVMDEGEAVDDIMGGVWVEDPDKGQLDFGGPMEDMMGDAPMAGPGMKGGNMAGGGISNGRFELKVPSGTYNFGVGMPPSSGYTFVPNATSTAVVAGENTVNLRVKSNNYYIKGQLWFDEDGDGFYDVGDEEIGLTVMVNADQENGGWQMAQTDANGAYTLQVCEGNWYVDAFIDPFMMHGPMMGMGMGSRANYMIVSDKAKVTSVDSSNDVAHPAIRNFEVKKLDATISGTVYKPNLDPAPNVWVFADFGDEDTKLDFKGPGLMLGALTDADGNYTIYLAAGTYKIGAGLPPWANTNWINPDFLSDLTVTSDAPLTGQDLYFRESNATISGQIKLDGVVKSGFVRAWSDNGVANQVMSTDGSYSLDVISGDVWHVSAVRKEANGKFYKSDELRVNVSEAKDYPGQDLTLEDQGMTIPDEKMVTFDASKQKTIKLQDGTTLDMPAGSIKANGSVTITITPTTDLNTMANAKPLSYGYTFKATDPANNNKPISKFVSNITITIPFGDIKDKLVDLGIVTLDGDGNVLTADIVPQYWDSTNNVWKKFNNVTIDKAGEKVIIKTNHFTDVGLLGDYSGGDGEGDGNGNDVLGGTTGGSGSASYIGPTNISLSINHGDLTTTSRNVVLTLSAVNATEFIISNTSDFSESIWQDYIASIPWVLSKGDGEKIVYVKYKDASSNESSIVSDSIILEEFTDISTLIFEQDLVKTADSPAIYLILNNKRHVFPHIAVYNSWNYPDDFSTVKLVSSADLVNFSEGNAVPFRDGSMFRGTASSLYDKSASAVFYVEDGKLRPIQSGEIYQELFDDEDWELVTWVPDDLLDKFAYPLGEAITSSDAHPNGCLVKYANSSAVYLVSNGELKPFVSWSALVSNKYGDQKIFTIPRTETYVIAESIMVLAESLTTPVIISGF